MVIVAVTGAASGSFPSPSPVLPFGYSLFTSTGTP